MFICVLVSNFTTKLVQLHNQEKAEFLSLSLIWTQLLILFVGFETHFETADEHNFSSLTLVRWIFCFLRCASAIAHQHKSAIFSTPLKIIYTSLDQMHTYVQHT